MSGIYQVLGRWRHGRGLHALVARHGQCVVLVAPLRLDDVDRVDALPDAVMPLLIRDLRRMLLHDLVGMRNSTKPIMQLCNFLMFDLEESASHPLPLQEGVPQVVRSTLLQVTGECQIGPRGFLHFGFPVTL